MTVRKWELGIGVKDFHTANSVALTKSSEKCWTPQDTVLSDWLKIRYVKNSSLDKISFKPFMDSAMWKRLISNKVPH